MLIQDAVLKSSDYMPEIEANLQGAPEAKRGRTLLVEDDPAVRRYLEVMLQRAGFEVTAVSDGLAAIKQALASTFDAIVTDAILPYVSGREVCRFLRRQAQHARTPLLMLSGLQQTDADEADIFLVKPVRPEELINSLDRLIRQQR